MDLTDISTSLRCLRAPKQKGRKRSLTGLVRHGVEIFELYGISKCDDYILVPERCLSIIWQYGSIMADMECTCGPYRYLDESSMSLSSKTERP